MRNRAEWFAVSGLFVTVGGVALVVAVFQLQADQSESLVSNGWGVFGLVVFFIGCFIGLAATVSLVRERVDEARVRPPRMAAPVSTELDLRGAILLAVYGQRQTAERKKSLEAWVAQVDAEAQRVGGRRLLWKLRRGTDGMPEAAHRRLSWLAGLAGHSAPEPPPIAEAQVPTLDARGCLSLTLVHPEADDHHQPVAVRCEVEHDGSSFHTEAAAEFDSDGTTTAVYPSDFPGAPENIAEGSYVVRWQQGRWNSSRPEISSWVLLSDRDFTVHPDGTVT